MLLRLHSKIPIMKTDRMRYISNQTRRRAHQTAAWPMKGLCQHIGYTIRILFAYWYLGSTTEDLNANPLDYTEGGKFSARRAELSLWLDSTNPDPFAFKGRGGKMIVAIDTNDTLGSPGAQLDYYQSVLDKMSRPEVEVLCPFASNRRKRRENRACNQTAILDV